MCVYQLRLKKLFEAKKKWEEAEFEPYLRQAPPFLSKLARIPYSLLNPSYDLVGLAVRCCLPPRLLATS
jgi:hypothetical protein